MRHLNHRRKLFLIPFGIAAILAFFSFVVMSLWNWLLPVIFHVGAITFWQAMGIFVLCKILFGFGKGGHRWGNNGGAPWMRNKMVERFKNMSPEERENFKAQWESRMCGHRGRWGRGGRDPFDTKWDDFVKPEAEKAGE